MLKVLIVDDDKLTRKGLTAIMPWGKYDMEVVGECADGARALEFLADNQVDLVLSDLEMPVMTGLELMKKARERFPWLHFVVLTVHTDFEYIQQALRLGAIDYISKVQFDKENLDAILSRIAGRINYHLVSAGSNEERRINSGWVYALIETSSSGERTDGELFLSENKIRTKFGFWELPSGIWYWNTPAQEAYHFPECYRGCILLKISQTMGVAHNQMAKALLKYKQERFFWDYTGKKEVINCSYLDLQKQRPPINEEEFKILKERWLSFCWIKEEALFEKICFDLKQSNLTVGKLYHIMLALENAWERSYGLTAAEKPPLPPEFHHWQEIADWLGDLYERGAAVLTAPKLSGDLAAAMWEAKEFVDKNYFRRLSAEQLAAPLNISRSYFSVCFGRVVGIPFNKYLRMLRMEKAKEYLCHTSKSIAVISASLGYEDEKYFSRVFKKETGKSPGEYRKSAGGDGSC